MKSRKIGRMGIAATIASMMGGTEQKSYSSKWAGLMSHSVALTDHRAACNPVRKHKESQACARRRKQMYGSYGGRY